MLRIIEFLRSEEGQDIAEYAVMGKASEGMMVADRLRRKMKITKTTSPMVSNKVNFTSSTEARIETERS